MKGVLVFFAFILVLFLMARIVHGDSGYEVLRIESSTAHDMMVAGFPQIGDGRYFIAGPYPITPHTSIDLYQPTNEEIDAWLQVLTVGTISVNFTNSIPNPWTAVSSSPSASAVGMYPNDAKGNLLVKLKALQR